MALAVRLLLLLVVVICIAGENSVSNRVTQQNVNSLHQRRNFQEQNMAELTNRNKLNGSSYHLNVRPHSAQAQLNLAAKKMNINQQRMKAVTVEPPSQSNRLIPPLRSIFRHECPAEFLRLGNGCYFFSKSMADWYSAHFQCREWNSTLVEVTNAWEDKMLRRYLSKPEMARLNRWLGGRFDWSKNRWVWGSSDNIILYHGFLSSNSSNPHNARWKCVYASPALFYRWNYHTCYEPMHYICKAPFTRVVN